MIILFASGLLFWAGFALLLPTVTTYLQSIGYEQFEIGLVMGAFAIGLVAASPVMGWLADRVGRKAVLGVGLAIAALASLLYPLTQDFWLLTIIRTLSGASIAAFPVAFDAFVSDLAPKNREGHYLTLMNLVSPIGCSMGALMAVVVGIHSFALASVLCALGLSLSCLLAEPTAIRQQAGSTWTQIWQRVRSLVAILFVVGVAQGTANVFVPLYTSTPGLFFFLAAASTCLLRFGVGAASDKYGRRPFLMAALLALGVAHVCVGFGAFNVGAILLGAGSGVSLPMICAMTCDRIPPQDRGRAFSLVIGAFDLGIGLSGVLVGWTHPPFFLAAALVLILLINLAKPLT